MPRADIDALAEEVHEKGFCVLPQALNHSVIDEHIAQMAELIAAVESDFKHDATVLKSELRRRKMDLHRESTAANSLLFSEDIVGLIDHLAGAPVVMRQPETGFFQRGTPAHTDSLDFKVMPRSTEYRIWCALEDIDPRSGPVYFVPRSHRTISAVLEDSVAAERPDFLDLLQKQRAPTSAGAFFRETAFLWGQVKKVSLPGFIARSPSPPEIPSLAKGDVVVFSSDVVHGTCECTMPGLSRKYMVAYWSREDAYWFQTRSFWGKKHDYRCSDNAISAPVFLGRTGNRCMDFEELHTAYIHSFTKPVVGALEKAG